MTWNKIDNKLNVFACMLWIVAGMIYLFKML